MGFWVYILRCADQTLYSGATTDLSRRLQEHNLGKGSKYTRSRLPVKFVQVWQVETWSHALRLEAGLKKCSKVLKEKLIREPNLIKEWAIQAGYDFTVEVAYFSD